MIPGCLVVLLFAGMISSILYWIYYGSHKQMTIDHSKIWAYGTYSKFIEQIDKHSWEHSSVYNSLFDHPTNSEIHASIVRFDGRGMVLRRIDFIRYQMFLCRLEQGPSNAKYHKSLWNEKPDLKVVK